MHALIEWFTLPYMVICFGRLSMPVLRRAARFGDLSYGMYLYAFPMQQLVLYLEPNGDYPIVACALLTLPLAFLSWHLVEKPALRLKGWGPFGRGRPGSGAGSWTRGGARPPPPLTAGAEAFGAAPPPILGREVR